MCWHDVFSLLYFLFNCTDIDRMKKKKEYASGKEKANTQPQWHFMMNAFSFFYSFFFSCMHAQRPRIIKCAAAAVILCIKTVENCLPWTGERRNRRGEQTTCMQIRIWWIMPKNYKTMSFWWWTEKSVTTK